MRMSASSGSSEGRGLGDSWGSHRVLGTQLTPRGLLKRHKLPIAAHLHMPCVPLGLDLSRPLFIYKNYSTVKVSAYSMRVNRDGSLAVVGPALVIPESYTGWFALVAADGQTAPSYSCLDKVVAAKVSFFLTRYDITVFTISEDETGRRRYIASVVKGGHVLKLLGVYEDFEFKRTSPQNIIQGHTKFAQCLNFKSQVIYVPLKTSGRFYATAHRSSKNPRKVFLISQLLKNFKLPLTVRLVCGYMPRVPCSFTGLLRLERAEEEEVILACTMTPEADATLFEMDVDSKFLLLPVTDPIFVRSPIYLKTVSYCEDKAESWRRQIKVTHDITEKRSRSLTRSLSDKFFDPIFSPTRPFSLAFLGDFDRRWIPKGHRNEDGLWDISVKGMLGLQDKEPYKETRKRSFEKSRKRLCKQNTYIPQTVRKKSHSLSNSLKNARLGFSFSHSAENLISSSTDNLKSLIMEEEKAAENYYSEIAESDETSGTCDDSGLGNSGDKYQSNSNSLTLPKPTEAKEETEGCGELLSAGEPNTLMPSATEGKEHESSELPETPDKVSTSSDGNQSDVSVISVGVNDCIPQSISLVKQGSDTRRDSIGSHEVPSILRKSGDMPYCSSLEEEFDQEPSQEQSARLKSKILMRGNTVIIRLKHEHGCLDNVFGNISADRELKSLIHISQPSPNADEEANNKKNLEESSCLLDSQINTQKHKETTADSSDDTIIKNGSDDNPGTEITSHSELATISLEIENNNNIINDLEQKQKITFDQKSCHFSGAEAELVSINCNVVTIDDPPESITAEAFRLMQDDYQADKICDSLYIRTTTTYISMTGEVRT